MLKEWRAGLEEARDKWQKWNESKKISYDPRRSRAFWAMRGSKVFGPTTQREAMPPTRLVLDDIQHSVWRRHAR
jgi:hypothetical protein